MDENALSSGSGRQALTAVVHLPPPPGLVQKTEVEIEENTSRSNDEQINTSTVSRESLEVGGPDLELEGCSGSAEHCSNGDLDLVYDAKRRDWMSLEHRNFLTQRRYATEVNLKDYSSELQEIFVRSGASGTCT